MLYFFKKISFILAPIAFIMAAVSYTFDPCYIFHDLYAKSISRSLHDGREAAVSVEFDYRSLQRYMIEGMPSRPDVVVLGSSRSMPIGEDLFKNRVFFNSSQPCGTIKDMIAIFDLYERRGMIPKTVIVEIYPWFFNRTPDPRWITLYDEYYEGLENIYRYDKIAAVKIRAARHAFAALKYYRWLNLFYPAYFKLSSMRMLAFFKEKFEERFAPDKKIKDAAPCKAILSPDGSLLCSPSKEKLAGEMADRWARDIVSSMSRMKEVDPSIKRDFDSFLSYLKRSGVEVMILLVPINPLTYDAVNSRYGGAVDYVEKEVNAIARKDGIKEIGSYDPRKYGLKNTDFFDGVHPKRYVYEKIL